MSAAVNAGIIVCSVALASLGGLFFWNQAKSSNVRRPRGFGRNSRGIDPWKNFGSRRTRDDEDIAKERHRGQYKGVRQLQDSPTRNLSNRILGQRRAMTFNRQPENDAALFRDLYAK